MTFVQLFFGDGVDEKRKMDKTLPEKNPMRFSVVGESKDNGRRIMHTIFLKVYGTELSGLLDSGAVQNLLLKEFVCRLGI